MKEISKIYTDSVFYVNYGFRLYNCYNAY